MTKKLTKALTLAVATSLGSAANAACWNAADSGLAGPAVEICFSGQCQQTNMISECAMSAGAFMDYANGWSVNYSIIDGQEVVSVSFNEQAITAEAYKGFSCRDLDDDMGCRFPEALRAVTVPPGLGDLAKIEQYFRGSLGIDAEYVQLALLEAGLYDGTIDGVWGPGTADAFATALDWANSRGGQYDLSSEEGYYAFVRATRHTFFDIDSGLSRSPTGLEYLLVVASIQDPSAARDLADQYEAHLRRAGLPNLAYPLVTVNGWNAVVAGMYSQAGCQRQAERLKSENLIPADSYCAALARFDPFNWIP
jgi:hypothetical protein